MKWKNRAPLAALIAVLASACGERGAPPPAALHADMRPDKTVYQRGDPVELTLAVRNDGGRPDTLRFVTSQRYEFLVHDSRGTLIWRWSAGQTFTQDVGEQVLPAGWEMTYTERVPVRLAPGAYRALGVVTGVGRGMASETGFTVEERRP